MISRLLSRLPRARALPRSIGLAVCLSACLAMWACSGPGSGPGATEVGAELARWNQAIAGVCTAHGAHLVDLFPDWSELAAHPEYVSADGFHPSTVGAQRLAAIFAAAIRQTPAK